MGPEAVQPEIVTVTVLVSISTQRVTAGGEEGLAAETGVGIACVGPSRVTHQPG